MDAHIELTRTYKHEIGAVWSAISEWFIKADFEAKVGYDYTFTRDDTTITGTVSAQPPTELVYTWVIGGVTTTVRWSLSESSDGTVVKLVHDGLDAYGDSAATWFGHFEKGWTSCTDELEKYLSKVPANG